MIGIDITFMGEKGNSCGSISIFTADILDGFIELNIAKKFCLIVTEQQVEFAKKRFPEFRLCVITSFAFRLMRKFTGREGFSVMKKIGVYEKRIKEKDVSLIWFPFIHPGKVTMTKIPMVCTLHDLIDYYKVSKDSGKRDDYSQMIECSDRLIAISNYVKKEVQKEFSLAEEKIRVIPNSVRINCENVIPIPNLKGEFILDINAYAQHKNPITLLKAFRRIFDKVELDLVLVGAKRREEMSYYAMLESYIRDNHMDSRVHLLSGISEENKVWLLKNAKLFITPSMDEGFGRTPVEAVLCKTSVISTKAASLYEVTRGGVHYYENPTDDAELAELILKILQNPDSTNRLSAIAGELQEAYLPTHCAKMYLDVFSEVQEE